jgi:hypothetical protein
MAEWSWATWVVSVAAVVVSGLVALVEGNWRRRPGLDIGFGNHGGMWGDAVLLPVANAVIAPWVVWGWWVLWPIAIAAPTSVALHAWWHGNTPYGVRDHMWPTRPTGRWASDLSWAGWCHVAYVTGELALLLAYAATVVPLPVVVVVTAVLSIHVPLGLLQPAWFATGSVRVAGTRLMAGALATLWAVTGVKVLGS